MATKYRGKYPNRISTVYTVNSLHGVYGCTTNAGERYTFTARAMLQAGYTIAPSQLLKLDATTLSFLHRKFVQASTCPHSPAYMQQRGYTLRHRPSGTYWVHGS